MLEFWIVRHGQTDWNVERRVQGWTDIPLNTVGLHQAELLASHLHGVPFQAIYTSDLVRAEKTAAILHEQTGAPVTVDQRLRERRFGALEGQVRQQRAAKTSPDAPWDRLDDPLAETDFDLKQRVSSFLEDVCTQHISGRILIVTHGALIRAALELLCNESRVTLHNTSVTRLRYKNPHWRIVEINGTRHLQESSTAFF